MDITDGLHSCKQCNKIYSSYKSLWNHNKKFHTNDIIKNNHMHNHLPIKNNHCENIEGEKTKICKFCNKIFSHYNNKWRHEKKCKNNKLIKLKKEIEILESKKKILVTENNKLKNKNIQNINQNNCNNNINNGTIDNKHINNIVINQIGCEKIDSVPFNDILKILSTGNNMPITCIKNLNFNKNIPENHSFCTTTLEGKHFTRINHQTQKPEKVNKIDFINEVLESSLKFLNSISILAEFDDYFREKIPLEFQNKMKEILENQNKFHDPKNKKAFFNCINDMSYNFKDLILETWKLLQPKEEDLIEDDEPPLLDENYKYWSSDDESK